MNFSDDDCAAHDDDEDDEDDVSVDEYNTCAENARRQQYGDTTAKEGEELDESTVDLLLDLGQEEEKGGLGQDSSLCVESSHKANGLQNLPQLSDFPFTTIGRTSISRSRKQEDVFPLVSSVSSSSNTMLILEKSNRSIQEDVLPVEQMKSLHVSR